jgi:hypothetical protein
VGSRLRRTSLLLFGVGFLILFGMLLQSEFGLPFDTTYRVACAAMCIVFIYGLNSEYPGEKWIGVAAIISIIANIALFCTPLVDQPTSRGEVMFFALPDAAIVLGVRIASYRVTNDHQRAMRQQMILGFIVAVAFGAVILGLTLVAPRSARP